MIGILCGLKSEAKIADRIGDVLVGCSAGRAERAEELVAHMVGQGATRLISFGLSGATSEDLAAGDLVLGSSVMAAGEGWEADAAWNARLMDLWPCLACAVWGSKRVVSSLEEKAAIARRAGCLIVDMESHIVARAAAKARIPFNVMRAVADTADMVLPPAALVPLKPDGGVDLRGVFEAVRREPGQIPALFRLGRNSFLAHRALERAVEAGIRHLAFSS